MRRRPTISVEHQPRAMVLFGANGLTSLSLLLGALSLACGTSTTPSLDGAPKREGGTIVPPGCDYEVRTGFGASAPTVAQSTGATTAPSQIRLGISGNPASAMVIGWLGASSDEVGAAVRYGTAGLTGSAAALTWSYTDRGGEVLRMYETHLCGLDPDTTYSYAVDMEGTSSETHTFRTAPAADRHDAGVVFVALGDSRGSPETLGRLLRAAEAIATPDLILFTGDAVAYGADQSQWTSFFEQTGETMRRVPTISTVGNHEEGDQIFFSMWGLPGDERRFSLDYGPVHLTVVDDSTTLFPDQNGEGLAFLQSDLAGPRRGMWRIVMHHQPLFSAQSIDGHGSTERLQQMWLPTLDAAEVDLVLSGHDHKYERSLPLRAGVPTTNGGTVYIVTGASGAPLYEAPIASWTAAAASVPHFLVIRARRQWLFGSVHDETGTRIDSFVRHRPMATP